MKIYILGAVALACFASTAFAQPETGSGAAEGSASGEVTTGTEPVPPTSEPAPPPETAPPAPPPPSMTLKQGGLLVMLNIEINMTNKSEFKPTSIAPDISYGVTDDLTVALIHSNAAMTGFRGAAGAGVCITGDMNGCPVVYENFGLEGLYSFMKGPFAIAGNLGLLGLSLKPASPSAYDFDIKAGAKMRYTAGKIYVLFLPSVWIGLTNREVDVAGMSVKLNRDQLWLPASVWFKALPVLDIGLATGIKGPLDNFGGEFTIPLGVLATYAITKQIGVGVSWVFGKVAGGDDVVDAMGNKTTGFDARAMHVWAQYKM